MGQIIELRDVDMQQPITIHQRRRSPDFSGSSDSYIHIPTDFDMYSQTSIETGYFVFTMMPSLRCSLNCPHCYLSLDQRRNSEIMSIENMEIACSKVADYYRTKPHIKRKLIVFYWYGGEPTEMGLDYIVSAFEMIDRVFDKNDGYYVRHDILTSLVGVDDAWINIFKYWGRGHFQTSFDGLMRGKGYMKVWDRKVRNAISSGLAVSTISVVNNELMKDGPEEILMYLSDLGVKEASFLPFMLNVQNRGDKYEKYAPPMNKYSEFMIDLSKAWLRLRSLGVAVPYIGQMSYIFSRKSLPISSNIAGQTMFLLPNGDFVLPDYVDGYLEYMKVFGNILNDSFQDVLLSSSRREYIRKQYLRNGNSECVGCEYKSECIMEFWKENRSDDDCFGAKKYVGWVLKSNDIEKALHKDTPLIF